MGRFTVVGLGPGSPEYLLPLARQVIEEAETLAGGRRHLAPFEGGKKKLIFLENGLESLLDAVDSRRESERIALLLSGDPCIFSLLGRIAARFSPGDYEVVPGLSSFQLLFARLASRPCPAGTKEPPESSGARRHGFFWNDVRLESLHGRSLDSAAALLGEDRRTLFFLDSENSGPAVAAFLRKRGFPDRPVTLAERLGYRNERICETSLFNLSEERTTEGLALLLVEPGPLPPLSKGVLPDAWFRRAEGVPLSKEATRALAVSLLLPLDGLPVLEVGAGSGGITVELARRIGNGSLVAVERSAPALGVAEENLRRSGAGMNVRLLHGSAPEILEVSPGIPPRFSRAVIGGHGGSPETIVEAVWERLAPGGRLLATANMPPTADRIYRTLKDLGAFPALMHVNASSARDMKTSWMLLASNPVFLVYADKNA